MISLAYLKQVKLLCDINIRYLHGGAASCAHRLSSFLPSAPDVVVVVVVCGIDRTTARSVTQPQGESDGAAQKVGEKQHS